MRCRLRESLARTSDDLEGWEAPVWGLGAEGLVDEEDLVGWAVDGADLEEAAADLAEEAADSAVEALEVVEEGCICKD